MNPTRVFTFAALLLVLVAPLFAVMGKFRETFFLLGLVVVAGIVVILWNVRK